MLVEENLKFKLQVPCLCKEIVAGTIAGIAGSGVSHPLDTVKVRMQTSQAASFLQTATLLYRAETLRGFYRGFLPPVLGAAPVTAGVFAGEALGEQLLNKT